jgi:hypothetical protein
MNSLTSSFVLMALAAWLVEPAVASVKKQCECRLVVDSKLVLNNYAIDSTRMVDELCAKDCEAMAKAKQGGFGTAILPTLEHFCGKRMVIPFGRKIGSSSYNARDVFQVSGLGKLIPGKPPTCPAGFTLNGALLFKGYQSPCEKVVPPLNPGTKKEKCPDGSLKESRGCIERVKVATPGTPSKCE